MRQVIRKSGHMHIAFTAVNDRLGGWLWLILNFLTDIIFSYPHLSLIVWHSLHRKWPTGFWLRQLCFYFLSFLYDLWCNKVYIVMDFTKPALLVFWGSHQSYSVVQWGEKRIVQFTHIKQFLWMYKMKHSKLLTDSACSDCDWKDLLNRRLTEVDSRISGATMWAVGVLHL